MSHCGKELTLYHTIPSFNDTCYQHFSFSHKVFSTLSKTEVITLATPDLSSVNALSFVNSKNLSFVKDLRVESTF